MKVKNNTKNLIPRKQIGGLVRKYQLAAGSRGIERYKPTFTDRIILISRNTPQNRTVNGAIVAARNNTGLPIGSWPKYTSNTKKMMTTWADGETTMYINDNKDSIGLDGTIYNSNGDVIGTDGIITTTSKPAQTDIVDKKEAVKRNNKITVKKKKQQKVETQVFAAKPAATTFTESPTNITDQGWLDARNAAMQRGWGTYNYNGQTYKFTGDEKKQAANNWRNRRKAEYQAEGILNLNPPAEVTAMIPRGDGEVKPEDAIVEKNTPIDSKTTPYTFQYQQQLTNNPNLTRDMLWQATQDVRNGNRDASYYGESSDLVSQLANANQDSAKNYIYNLWNTNNDVATQAGRKNYTESQGLTFGEPTTNNAAFQSINTNQPPMYYTGPGSWLTDNSWKKKIDDIYTRYKQNTQSARQGTKLIRRK